jgi:hypothetical protein
MVYKMTNFKTDTTNNLQKWEPEGLPPWNGQWQNNLPRGFKLGSRVHQPHTWLKGSHDTFIIYSWKFVQYKFGTVSFV